MYDSPSSSRTAAGTIITTNLTETPPPVAPCGDTVQLSFANHTRGIPNQNSELRTEDRWGKTKRRRGKDKDTKRGRYKQIPHNRKKPVRGYHKHHTLHRFPPVLLTTNQPTNPHTHKAVTPPSLHLTRGGGGCATDDTCAWCGPQTRISERTQQGRTTHIMYETHRKAQQTTITIGAPARLKGDPVMRANRTPPPLWQSTSSVSHSLAVQSSPK